MSKPSLVACALLSLGTLLSGTGCRTAAPIHPPGSAALVGCGENGELDWINLDSGKRKRTYGTAHSPDIVRVAPSGGLVAVLDRKAETVTVFDIGDRVQRRVIELPAGSRPTDIDFIDRRSHLAVACPGNGSLITLGLKTGEVANTVDCGGTPVALAGHFEQDRVAVALTSPNSVVLLDSATGKELRRIALPATPGAIAQHPTRDELWVLSPGSNVVMVVDSGAARVRVLPCPGGPRAVRVSYDGKTALVMCAASGEIAAFDTRFLTEAWRSTPPVSANGKAAFPAAIELEPPGAHLLVVMTNANRLDEVEVETGKWLRSLQTAPRPLSVGWLRVRTTGRLDSIGHF